MRPDPGRADGALASQALGGKAIILLITASGRRPERCEVDEEVDVEVGFDWWGHLIVPVPEWPADTPTSADDPLGAAGHSIVIRNEWEPDWNGPVLTDAQREQRFTEIVEAPSNLPFDFIRSDI